MASVIVVHFPTFFIYNVGHPETQAKRHRVLTVEVAGEGGKCIVWCALDGKGRETGAICVASAFLLNLMQHSLVISTVPQ
jgi:hypothetical protein